MSLKVADETVPAVRGDFPEMQRQLYNELVSLSAAAQREHDAILARARTHVDRLTQIRNNVEAHFAEAEEDLEKLTRR